MIFLNKRMELPWAEMAMFVRSFFINFFKSWMKDLTRFSTSAKDSPFGGRVLKSRCHLSY